MKKLFKQILVLSVLSSFAGLAANAIESKTSPCQSAQDASSAKAQQVKVDQSGAANPVAGNANQAPNQQ
jgi:hypothetical protein